MSFFCCLPSSFKAHIMSYPYGGGYPPAGVSTHLQGMHLTHHNLQDILQPHQVTLRNHQAVIHQLQVFLHLVVTLQLVVVGTLQVVNTLQVDRALTQQQVVCHTHNNQDTHLRWVLYVAHSMTFQLLLKMSYSNSRSLTRLITEKVGKFQ